MHEFVAWTWSILAETARFRHKGSGFGQALRFRRIPPFNLSNNTFSRGAHERYAQAGGGGTLDRETRPSLCTFDVSGLRLLPLLCPSSTFLLRNFSPRLRHLSKRSKRIGSVQTVVFCVSASPTRGKSWNSGFLFLKYFLNFLNHATNAVLK